MSIITLAHGSGGRMTHDLISKVFFKRLGNQFLNASDDSAVLPSAKEELVYTTDSFVVKPIFFPGGDIGKLAICGTVNDLAVNGAVPKYLSCGFIIEEGTSEKDLEKIVESMAHWSKEAEVMVVCGDTKVVEKGAADGVFINTSGVGYLNQKAKLDLDKVVIGDKIIVTGTVGDHGIAVLSKRKGLDFESQIQSDCAPLNKMICDLVEKADGVKFMRDPTRGGLVTTLNELTENKGFGMVIRETDIPVSESVKAACELLGLDPIYIANEGKAIVIAKEDSSDEILSILHNSKYGADAAIIGEVAEDNSGRVCLETVLGTVRPLDMLNSEPIPRIC